MAHHNWLLREDISIEDSISLISTCGDPSWALIFEGRLKSTFTGATIKSTFHAESSTAIVITKLPSNYRRAIASINGNEKSKACKLAVRICETRSSCTARGFGSPCSFENSLPHACTRGKFVSRARNRESEFTFLRDSIIVERRDYGLRSLGKILQASRKILRSVECARESTSLHYSQFHSRLLHLGKCCSGISLISISKWCYVLR